MTLPELKTHLAEQIALADKEPHWWCEHCKCEVPPTHVTYDETHDTPECLRPVVFRDGASARTNLPKLCRQLKVALEVIEEQPHETNCELVEYGRGPCTCWKSRAIARITETL